MKTRTVLLCILVVLLNNYITNSQTKQEFFDRGKLKYEKKDYAGAVNDLTKAISLGFYSDEVYYLIGDSKLYLKDYIGAIDYCTKSLNINPKNFSALWTRGTAKNEIKDYLGALNDVNRLINFLPDFAFAYNLRYYIKKGLNKSDGEACLDYGMAKSLDSSFITPLRELVCGIAAQEFNDSALYYSNVKDYTKSVSFATKAIMIDPNSYNYYNNRGYSKFMLEDFRGALNDYSKAIELCTEESEDVAKIICNRGLAKMNLNNYDKALLDFNKAIRIFPNYAEGYLYRGLTYLKLNQKEKGCLDLSKAGELGNDYAYKVIKEKCK